MKRYVVEIEWDIICIGAPCSRYIDGKKEDGIITGVWATNIVYALGEVPQVHSPYDVEFTFGDGDQEHLSINIEDIYPKRQFSEKVSK